MRALFRILLLSLLLFQINNAFILFSNKDPELEIEYEKILTIVKQHCEPNQYYLPEKVIGKFDKLTEEIAYCQIRLNGFKLVFDKHYWKDYTLPIDKTQLMMHEMTHCLFKQNHVSDSSHFMAPFFVSIPEAILYKQFDDFLRNRCGK